MSSGRPHIALDVAANLLKQLCLQFHHTPRELELTSKLSYDKLDRRSKLEVLIKAFEEISRDINQPTMIVIDALDEANMRDQVDFQRLFGSLNDTAWKLILISRSNQYSLPKALHDCVYFNFDEEDIASDIRFFVDTTLRENRATDQVLSCDFRLRSEVIETLTARSNGM